jgi:hypothetical protein
MVADSPTLSEREYSGYQAARLALPMVWCREEVLRTVLTDLTHALREAGAARILGNLLPLHLLVRALKALSSGRCAREKDEGGTALGESDAVRLMSV